MEYPRWLLWAFCVIVLAGCSDSSPTDDNGDNGGNPGGDDTLSEQVTVTPSGGGTVTVTSAVGDIYTLTIPAGGVSESTVITMTTRAETPESPFSQVVIPGVDITPHGFMLNEPAMLTVTFADPPDSIDYCSLFWAEAPDRGILLDYYDSNGATIGGGISHFSSYGSAQLNAAEIENQSYEAESYLDELNMVGGTKIAAPLSVHEQDDPYGWREFYFAAGWQLKVQRMCSLIGNDERAEELSEKLGKAMDREISNFLNRNVDDMCDPAYKQALGKYANMVEMIGLADSIQLKEQIQERMVEMMDRCSSRFQLDFFYEQTTSLPGHTDYISYGGTVEFYLPDYTLGNDDSYGTLAGEGKLTVSGSGSSKDGSEECSWSSSGSVDVTVGGNVNSIIINDTYEQFLNIVLELNYNVYQNKECCYDGEDCTDLSGSTLVGLGQGFTIEMPIENGHVIDRPSSTEYSSSRVMYTLHVLNNMFQ